MQITFAHYIIDGDGGGGHPIVPIVVVAAPTAAAVTMVVVAVAPVVVCWSVNNIILNKLKRQGGLTLWSPVLVVGI